MIFCLSSCFQWGWHRRRHGDAASHQEETRRRHDTLPYLLITMDAFYCFIKSLALSLYLSLCLSLCLSISICRSLLLSLAYPHSHSHTHTHTHTQTHTHTHTHTPTPTSFASVQVMNLQLTEEVEKLENMLKLQSSINKDLHKVIN